MRFRFAVVTTIFLFGAATPAVRASGLEGERLTIPLEGRWTAPVPSPDGTWLAFTADDYRGLQLLELSTGRVVTVSRAAGAGFHPLWSPDGERIAFRTAGDGAGAPLRIVVARTDGSTETASPVARSLSLPRWNGSELEFETFDGENPRPLRSGPDREPRRADPSRPFVSPGGRIFFSNGRDVRAAELTGTDGKVFFLPVTSPDGRHFVVQCLDGHLYLGSEKDHRLEDLGPGSHPSFVRGGRAILFERTGDDGHRLTSGDLFLLDLASRNLEPLTDTPDRIERRPAATADGRTIFWEEDGVLRRGWIR